MDNHRTVPVWRHAVIIALLLIPLGSRIVAQPAANPAEAPLPTETAGPDVHTAAFDAALAMADSLYARGNTADAVRADDILTATLQTYGTSLTNRQAAILFKDLWTDQEQMSAETRTGFRTMLQRFAQRTLRTWDLQKNEPGRDYVLDAAGFSSYVRALFLAADRLKSNELRQAATIQWRRWFEHLAYHGVAGFGGGDDVFDAVHDVHAFTDDPEVRYEAYITLDYLNALHSGVVHPVLGLMLTGSDAPGRSFLDPLRSRQPLPSERTEYDAHPKIAAEVEKPAYPRRTEGRAGVMRFASWQTATAGLGTASGGFLAPGQIHFMAAAGRNDSARAVAWMPASESAVNGYSDQKDQQALVLFNRLPNGYQRATLRLSDEKAALPARIGMGLTSEWRATSRKPGHLVFTAYNHDLHVFPFTYQDRTVQLVDLNAESHAAQAGRSAYDEYAFPDDAPWFGAVIVLAKAGVAVQAPRINALRVGREVTVSTRDGLRVRVYEQMSGEPIELSDRDLRTAPLVRTPVYTLHPGELLQKAVN